MRSFVQEYRAAPRRLAAALDAGDDAPLPALAHNLKSSAAYIGAHALAASARQVEEALRAGQPRARGALARPGRGARDGAGGPGAAGRRARPARGRRRCAAGLVPRLAAWLAADDARAGDALAQLQRLLPGPGYRAPLDAIAHAVDELEYQAALAPLARLAQLLGLNLEETA